MDQLGVLDFLKHLQIRVYEPRETVFHEDDFGRNYYFIIEGSVFILVNQNPENRKELKRKRIHLPEIPTIKQLVQY